MSETTDKSAKAVASVIEGAKILVPFVTAIATVVWFAADAKEERALLQQEQAAAEKERAEFKAELAAVKTKVQSNEVTLSAVKTDLKHIKDDTKETLDLVRTYLGRGN